MSFRIDTQGVDFHYCWPVRVKQLWVRDGSFLKKIITVALHYAIWVSRLGRYNPLMKITYLNYDLKVKNRVLYQMNWTIFTWISRWCRCLYIYIIVFFEILKYNINTKVYEPPLYLLWSVKIQIRKKYNMEITFFF